jgi:hypothetical protein
MTIKAKTKYPLSVWENNEDKDGGRYKGEKFAFPLGCSDQFGDGSVSPLLKPSNQWKYLGTVPTGMALETEEKDGPCGTVRCKVAGESVCTIKAAYV